MRPNGQILLLFSHLFLYFYFQVAGKEGSKKKKRGIAGKGNINLGRKAEGKWGQGCTYT